MKKIVLISIVTFFLFSGRNYSTAQAMQKGDLVVTGFSSYPNWGKFGMETVLQAFNINDYVVNGFPPSGVKLEFMLSDEIGFTLDGIFNSWNAKWKNNGFNYEASIFRTRIQIGMNYHIPDLDSDNLDLYGGFGIGSNSNLKRFESNDEFADEEKYFNNSFLSFPLSARVRAGVTYYVSQMIGINAELALGGPVIGLGVVVKP